MRALSRAGAAALGPAWMLRRCLSSFGVASIPDGAGAAVVADTAGEDKELVGRLLHAGTEEQAQPESAPRARRKRNAVRLDEHTGLFPVVGAPMGELSTFLQERGLRPGHATTLFTALHRDGVEAADALDMLPPQARAVVADSCDLSEPEAVLDSVSADGTRKWLFRVGQDESEVETVFIPESDGRGVLCVSSSVGCALSCRFCHTGTQRLRRNLRPGEIVGQLQAARRLLGRFPGPSPTKGGPAGGAVTNVVFMGQGEPLLNWRSVGAAAEVITASRGGVVPPRKVTISTSGVAPAMPRVATEAGCSLALSLHATTDEVRNKIIPLNRSWGLAEVMEGMRLYSLAQSPRPPSRRELRRREREEAAILAGTAPEPAEPPTDAAGRPVGRRLVMFEYVMLAGVNDSLDDARRLAELARPFKCHVNLIPFNAWPGAPFESSEDDHIRRFGAEVLGLGVSCSVRWPKGHDIMAACGQLHSERHRGAQQQAE